MRHDRRPSLPPVSLLVAWLLAGLPLACRPAAPDPSGAAAPPTRPPTVTADPWAARGQPVRIRIPSIAVDAAIEALALTAQQKIAVPSAWDRVGWYREGYRPGEPGRAILSGHLDDDAGQPAVFSRLGDLREGQIVEIDYADGSRLTFAVEDQRLVDVDAVDAATWEAIFGASPRPMLSLITCDGVWDPGLGTYSQRRVVFATAR